MSEPDANEIQKHQPLKFEKCGSESKNDVIYEKPFELMYRDIHGKGMPSTEYKTQVSRMGPYKMYAANYSDYNTYVSPYDINRTIVPRNDEKIKKQPIPKGSNYSFSNSPALKRDL